ncbi:MAG: hypothetical protein V1874_11140 [Spirochaetota bacterium]
MTRIIKKIIVLTTILIGLILSNNNYLYAIGSFSLGINTGATYDPNNMENDIIRFNRAIEYQKEAVSGTKGEQIDVPYSFILGASLRYQFNFLLFRVGGHFTKPGAGTKGSFTPAGGDKNVIRISTYQAAFPVSMGFIVPVKEKTYFYLGGGITYYMASVKITQSNPASWPNPATWPNPAVVPPTDRKDSYYGNFPGWHLLVGAEVPLFDKYSITVEWMHQEGHSYLIKNRGLDNTGNKTSDPNRVINTKGDFILFGINYYISI